MNPTGERILVRSVNWLGDAVMSTPALVRLREAKPNAHITLLTHEKLLGLWEDQPYLDNVLGFADDESPLRIGSRLKQHHFTTGVILPNSHRSALEMWLGNIPERIGYARSFRNFFLTTPIAPRAGELKMRKRSPAEVRRLASSPAGLRERFPDSAHHIHQYLHLMTAGFGADATPLAPTIHVPLVDLEKFRNRFNLSESSVPIFGLNPGAEYGPAKRWPKERFITTAVQLHKATSCRWVIFGGKADQPLAEEICSGILNEAPQSQVTNVSGQTSLRELCAALKICSVVLTNDTGPMHVAAAVGTGVVVPFGSTSPDLTGPGLSEERKHICIATPASCSPCFLRECPIDFRCMLGITEQQVVTSCLELYRQSQTSSGK